MKEIKKIALLTGGGDCCGLNAVIRGVVRTAILKYKWEVMGFIGGYYGLYADEYVDLTLDSVEGILKEGGTILKNSNKDNLFHFYHKDENGKAYYTDESDVAVANLKKHNVDALVIIGGDGTLTSARDFVRKGVTVVGVPKTIDNDVKCTDITFGYSSSLNEIMHALDCIRTTGYSHNRVMTLEVMGRHSGWLALEGGLAGGADMILIPEIPYRLSKIKEFIEKKYQEGKKSIIICVSEGAKAVDGDLVINRVVEGSPDSVRLGGIGAKLAPEIESVINTGQEVRNTNLAYIQRGGTTCCFDRVLGTKYGSFACDVLNRGESGVMVALHNEKLVTVPISQVVGDGQTGETSKGGGKEVDPNGELVMVARSIGVSFGD